MSLPTMSAAASATSSGTGGGPSDGLFAVLTSLAAAAYLQVPEAALIAEAEAGRLPGRRIGGEWRFLKYALADWLQRGGGPQPLKPVDVPAPDETPEEQEAFLAGIQAFRDEIDRATGFGKYAQE